MASKLSTATFVTLDANEYRSILNPAVQQAHDMASQVKPAIEHPLDPALRANVKGWLRLTLPARAAGDQGPRSRDR